jgi:predicted helicase
VKELGYTKIFIVVPSLYLLSQTYETWMMETQYEKDKFHFILIGSDMDNKEELLCEYKPTTDKNKIKEELEEFNKVVVIATYHSSELLIDVCKQLDYKFDMGIFDEAHRTVGEEEKCFTKIMSSEISEKRLFMTATEKIYNINRSKKTDEEKETVLSMDNEKVYGKVIYRYSMRQAIEDGVLVDYRIIAPFINSKKYDEQLKTNVFNSTAKNRKDFSTEQLLNNQFVNDEDITYDTRIILTGLMIISSMEEFKFKHLLIFSNTNNRAKKIMEFIELYLSKSEHPLKEILNCKYLSGNDSMNKRKGEVKEFENCEYGIISSARIFGEGIDIKICDAICFADGKSSSVDIVQYVGRCLRKCDTIPNKLSYVLVPFVLDEGNEFFDYDNQSYVKLRKILKTIGTTDEMVTEKFIIMDCNNKNYKSVDKSESDVKYENNGKIDVNEFTKNILSKVFDKTGDAIDRTRNILIFENKRRYENKEELIDTRKKCIQYLKSKNINDEPQNIKNWVKYSLGEKLFVEIWKLYYTTIDEFKDACIILNINNSESYKQKYKKNIKLPPYEYINNGYYTELNKTFNIDTLLFKMNDDCDF